MKTLRSF